MVKIEWIIWCVIVWVNTWPLQRKVDRGSNWRKIFPFFNLAQKAESASNYEFEINLNTAKLPFLQSIGLGAEVNSDIDVWAPMILLLPLPWKNILNIVSMIISRLVCLFILQTTFKARAKIHFETRLIVIPYFTECLLLNLVSVLSWQHWK